MFKAGRISNTKNASKKKKPVVTGGKKNTSEGMRAFLDSLGHKLPKNYKFNREEANER